MPLRPKLRPGRVIAPAAIAGLALIVAACGGGTSNSASGGSSSASGETLSLALTQGSYENYNPWGPSNGINGTLWSNQALYDSLTRLNSHGQPVPSVATSWQISGSTVTLQLRSGIKFSDGTPLDAAAVKANLDYGAANPNGAECNAYITGMKTAVLTSTSVKLTLPHPIPGLLQDFAQCAGFIVSPKALADPSSLTSTPDGSGPYTLDKGATTPGQVYTYVRRAGYWDATSFPFSKIVVTAFSTNTAADNAARSGQVQGIQLVDPKDTSSGLTLVATQPDDYSGFYFTDVTGAVSKPLGSLQVRQAMNYAVDRQALASALFGKYASVSGSSPFNSAYLGSSTAVDSTYPYDAAKAKQMLQAAGFGSGFSVPTLVDPGDEQLAQAIAGYEQKVGINLQISVHSSDYITQMLSGKWPIVFGHYTLNPAQLQTVTGIVGPSGFWNPKHNSNPTFNSLLAQITAAPTTAAQAPLYSELAKDVANQAWTINPVFLSTIGAYNLQKLSVATITGVPVPMLYNIKPKG
jgi:peptide/nickel transport system substrate-binding protein